MGHDDLPGGIWALIDGRVHAASHVSGQSNIRLVDDGDRIVDRAGVERLFKRTISGRWRGEPVAVWRARSPGFVRVQYLGRDWDHARSLGMRGDRTMWECDVLPSEVTVTDIQDIEVA